MDTLVPRAYRKYGKYVNSFRAFPLKEDGLKPVERRLLLTAHLIAREKYVKSARVTGTCMARFHPHSDSYGTLVVLANQGFIDGQGNWGSNLGVDPTGAAASRYTECRISKHIENMAFKLISHVNWIESELDDEPEALPTMFPFCLMGNDYTQGIGFGFRTMIPCYSLEDLNQRLIWLLNGKKAEDKPLIKPKTDCKILSDDATLESLLTVGKAKIDLQGVMNVSNVNCKVVVKSWPPGKRFQSILNKAGLKKYFDNQDIGFIDSSSGKNGTAVVFSVLKQRNRQKIFAGFVKQLKSALTGSITFENITVDLNGVVGVTSVDEMLLMTYNRFTESNKRMLEHKIEKATEMIFELNDLDTMKSSLIYVMQQGGITRDNLNEKIEQIAGLSHLSIEKVKEIINKYKIQKLMTINTDVTELQSKVSDLTNTLNNLDSFVLTQYQEVV